MLQIIENILLALLPVPLVYLLYRRHFNLYRPRITDHLEAFLYGVALAAILLLFGYYFFQWLPLRSPAAIGFIKAALLEKAGAYIMIYFLVRRLGERLMVMDAVIASMILGIGFSAVENMFYAADAGPRLIAVRLFSAVLLHACTCGMIGYYLALARFNNATLPRVYYMVVAFLLPYLLHGFFDTALLSGGRTAYFIGIILVIMIVTLEYFVAHAQTIPGREALDAMDLRYEDWLAIQREPQYERWILRSMGTDNSEHTPLLRWNPGRSRLTAMIILALVAIAFIPLSDWTRKLLQLPISPYEATTLLSILPAAYALNLLAVGSVNPAYFRNSLIRLPVIADAKVLTDQDTAFAITYDITTTTCLVKTVDAIPAGTPIEARFSIPGVESPVLHGVVVWDNHENPNQPSGTVLSFHPGTPGYSKFLFRYYFFKLVRGLIFNLRIPGFEGLRRLFVRPDSVMQDTKRFAAGKVLFTEGEPGNHFYMIRKGQVELYHESPEGEINPFAVLGEGDIFGEMAIVGNQPRAASARCQTDCELAVADDDNLDALIESNPDFTLRLIRNLANRMKSSEQRMGNTIAYLKDEAADREKLFFAGLNLMLMGMGFEEQDDALVVPMNRADLPEHFQSHPELTRSLLTFLMRFESIHGMDHPELERLLSSEVLALARKRLMVGFREEGSKGGTV